MSLGLRAAALSVNGWNAEYLDRQYELFRGDPASVPADLRSFFQGFELALAGLPAAAGAPAQSGAQSGAGATRAAAVQAYLDSFRRFGHLAATIDPFGRARPRPAALSPSEHGLSEADLDSPAPAPFSGTVRDAADRLERTYCSSMGVEFAHIPDPEERRWLRERVERDDGRIPLDRGQRAHQLLQLVQAESFEKFIGRRYPGEKRFSLEGSESLIPLMNHTLEAASALGVEEVVLGMAHRGRLNVLNNVLGKTCEQIFTEFEDSWEEDFIGGGGDVKYHRGYSATRTFGNGRTLHLAMASNPSHLESVNAVVLGRCRAKQRLRNDTAQRRRVIPMLIHGDAAIAGQGMVAEVLNLAYLEGYTVGGCVHVVINNLIGFTTSPEDARSTPYCTDVAKMIDAPVFHVNGEDPEACVAAAQFAIEYRQAFGKDVFIDLVCFRRYGHNEQDEASFTQPQLVGLIGRKQGVLKVYAERLLAEGVITEDDMAGIRRRLDDALEAAQQAARQTPYDPTIDPGGRVWSGITGAYRHDPVETGVAVDRLAEVCAALARVPDSFNLNPKLRALVQARGDLPRSGAVNHADAELLAFGSLLLEGTPVRLSGQDSRRGTFSQRHAVLRDTSTEERYCPLNHMREMGVPGSDEPPLSVAGDGRTRQARFCVYDSPLSEQSVLGFDYGYSLADPNMLVCWEAQFGDFANGAQVIIDQYLAPSELKWGRWSGLVMLLPHGYEGAGPEHSSCRLERFLQLFAGDNLQVAYPTTGAQMFHLLRRQVSRPFRKPLIVATPKSMLRVPTSRFDELTRGSFREVLDDPAFAAKAAPRAAVTRVILCCGKLYHELADRRDDLKRADVAIVRVEQVAPFHAEMLRSVLASYPPKAERVWVQEEPRNIGCYHFVADACRTSGLGDLAYIGRDASASSAVGSKSRHKVEQESILARAVGPKPSKNPPPDEGSAKKPRSVGAPA